MSIIDEIYPNDPELKIISFIDRMVMNSEFQVNRCQNPDRFVKVVKQMIDLTWDRQSGFELEFNSDYSVLKKKRLVSIEPKINKRK